MKLIILLLVCGWCVCAFADEPVGTVTFVEGIADVLQADGKSMTLREGQLIELKDRIRTKSYSKISIKLTDESVLKLAPSSCVSIEEFRISASGVRQRAVVHLSRGKAEAVVAKTGAPETFIIETPNARGSVKGSDIFVSYLAGKTGMFVDRGALSVINPMFPKIQHTLTPGKCVFVPLDNPPEQPRQTMKTEMSLNKRDVEPALVKKWIPSENASVMKAEIISLTGTVRTHNKSKEDWSAAANGDVISEGDILQTDADSSAEIRLSNGNSLFIEPSTELIFTSLRYDPNSGNYENKLEVIEGKLLAVVEKISGESTFEVRTPTAISGVRGTIMRVIVEPPRPGMPVAQTQVFFEGGRGIVTSLQNGARQQLLPGQNVQVSAKGIISQPMVTSPEQRVTTLKAVSPTQMINHPIGPKGPPKEGFMPLPLMPSGQKDLFTPLPPPPGTNILLPPPLPFDQVNTTVWYKAPLDLSTTSSTFIHSATGDLRQIALKDNGTWNMVFNGAYSGNVSPGWNLQLLNPVTGDQVNLNSIPVGLPMTPPPDNVKWVGMTDFNGQIKGTDVDRSLTLGQVTVLADTTSHHVTVDAQGTYAPK